MYILEVAGIMEKTLSRRFVLISLLLVVVIYLLSHVQLSLSEYLLIPNLKTLAPWEKIYDKPRQYIKKQRRQFADQSTYSQSYGFFQ